MKKEIVKEEIQIIKEEIVENEEKIDILDKLEVVNKLVVEDEQIECVVLSKRETLLKMLKEQEEKLEYLEQLI